MRQRKKNERQERPQWRLLWCLAVCCWVLYGLVGFLSQKFAYGSSKVERPLPLVIGLFLLAFCCYWVAATVAAKLPATRQLLCLIFLPALVFRCTMLASEPIQEIDIYRYLWDGAVVRAGVNPYYYPPRAVIEAPQGVVLPDDLARLVALGETRAGMKEVLRRVGFPHLPTVYPPVSQVGFCLVDAICGKTASVSTRVNVMRGWLILVELGTTVLVVLLLRAVGMPEGWAILHAWCPLLVKETGNSGHLDAMAVWLTTLSVYFVVRLLQARPTETPASLAQPTENPGGLGGIPPWSCQAALRLPPPSICLIWACLAAVTLSLGVGAKLYPVVLGFWFCAACIRSLGWGRSSVPLLIFLASTWLVLRPILPSELAKRPPEPDWVSQPSEGLEAFIGTWEMNDFLFLIAIENLKDTDRLPPEKRAWFAILPASLRQSICGLAETLWDLPPRRVPFVIARGFTAVVFCVLALLFAVWAIRSSSTVIWLRMAFLTIAWFFLLCPTQNPWYWSWALPLLPFARSRVWWLMSGLLFLYYLRFWFGYHFADVQLGGTPYVGTNFFDLVMTWVEFAPWFGLLMFSGFRTKPPV